MRVIEGIRGNVEADPALAAARDRHRERGTLERLHVDETQRRRSRFRARTDAGTELGVVVPGTEPLVPGDVLLDEDVMIVVELAESPTLAVTFDAETEPATAAVAGHAVGNRHWDLAVESGTVYVPAGPDPDTRCEMLERVLPADATIERAAVPPSLFDEESAADADSSEDRERDHTHEGEQEHAHDADGHVHEESKRSDRESPEHDTTEMTHND